MNDVGLALAETAIFVALGPLVGGVIYALLFGLVEGDIVRMFDWELIPYHAVFISLVYQSAWKSAIVAGAIVAVARYFGLRGYLLQIFTAGTGYVALIFLSSAGSAIVVNSVVLALSAALAAVVCALIAGMLQPEPAR